MSRWGRDPDAVRLDIAHAIGTGRDVIEYLRERHHAEGWNQGGEV